MTRSGKTEFATDLQSVVVQSQSPEEQFAEARAKIMSAFSRSLPEVIESYVELATSDEIEPETRRKAADRILDTFVPTVGKMQHAPGTTIQILNAMPIPEMKVIDGKETKLLEVGGSKYAIPPPVKRVITPEPEQPTKRAQFLGPEFTPGSKSPAPEEKP